MTIDLTPPFLNYTLLRGNSWAFEITIKNAQQQATDLTGTEVFAEILKEGTTLEQLTVGAGIELINSNHAIRITKDWRTKDTATGKLTPNLDQLPTGDFLLQVTIQKNGLERSIIMFQIVVSDIAIDNANKVASSSNNLSIIESENVTIINNSPSDYALDASLSASAAKASEDAAEAAATAALTAKTGAETAKTGAETAKTGAENLLSQVSLGSPKGSFATLAALNTANPNHSFIYVTIDDGKWNYYNGTAFVAGGQYQAAIPSSEIIAANAKFAYGSNDVALFGGSIVFSSSQRKITVSGGVLNRLGTFFNLASVVVDFTSVQSGDYGLYFDPATNTLSTAIYNLNVSANKHYCLAKFTWNTTNFLKPWYCIYDFTLDGVAYTRYVEKQTMLNYFGAAGDGNVLYNGSVFFDSTAKTIVISGAGILNRLGTFQSLSGTTIDMSTRGNNDYLIAANQAGAVVLCPYNQNVINDNLFVIARVQWTNNVFVVVRYCICDYTLDGVAYGRYIKKTLLQLTGASTGETMSQDAITRELALAAKNFVYGSNDVALFGGNIIFDSTQKRITVSGGVLNRLGTFSNLSSVVVDFTSVGQSDYGLYLDPATNTLSIAGYNSNVSANKHYCLARFTWNGTIFNKPWYIISDFTLDGVAYTRYVEKGKMNGSAPNLKWCEIGDSITMQDNKKEDDGTGTGYVGSGYGQRICSKLGITYTNHYPRGFNGNSLVNVASTFSTTPTNTRTTLPVADLYTIFLGTNDWGTQATNLGTQADYINNTFDTTPTSYGALRRLIDLCIGRPMATGIISDKGTTIPRIVLITPMRRGLYGYKAAGTLTKNHEAPPSFSYDAQANIIETVNSRGFTLKQIADMIKWVGQYEGIKVIDLYDDSRFVPLRYLNTTLSWTPLLSETAPPCWNDILSDNLHPSGKGYDLLFNRILNDILSIIPEWNK